MRAARGAKIFCPFGVKPNFDGVVRGHAAHLERSHRRLVSVDFHHVVSGWTGAFCSRAGGPIRRSISARSSWILRTGARSGNLLPYHWPGQRGLPGTIGFVPMELLISGSVDQGLGISLALAFAAMFNGIAIMRAYFALFTGRRPTTSISLQVTPTERLGIIILALVVFLGGWFSPSVVASRHRVADELLPATERSSYRRTRRRETLIMATGKAAAMEFASRFLG